VRAAPRSGPPAGLRRCANERATGELLQEKIALAWDIVHGFATLTLDNALFAQHAGGRGERAPALRSRLLQMSQPGFEMRAPPSR
jgi:hypothetical protein